MSGVNFLQSRNKPMLLVDIDGVISLFGFHPDQRPEGSFAFVDGIPHLLSATAGRHLLRLAEAFELVWCSGWEEKADEHLPHLLGLPAGLPHLTFGPDAVFGTAHWKLAAIDAHAGRERPVAWIDDCLDERCQAWAAARPGPTLLVQTDAARGMTEQEVQRLLAWAGELR
jgi:Swiss Army Knife RNA repair-like protein